MGRFEQEVGRALDQIIATQQKHTTALLVLNANVNLLNTKANIIMANTENLDAALANLEAQADQTVAAMQALAAAAGSGGVTQEQVDTVTARVNAVSQKLADAGQAAIATVAKGAKK